MTTPIKQGIVETRATLIPSPSRKRGVDDGADARRRSGIAPGKGDARFTRTMLRTASNLPNAADAWLIRFDFEGSRGLALDDGGAALRCRAAHSADGLSLRRSAAPSVARCEARPARAPESKTGPRDVLLGKAARELLDHLSKIRSGEWVFPGKASEKHMSEGALYWFWCWVRDETGIVADTRLHDLSHSHASHAIMKGADFQNGIGSRSPTASNRASAARY